MNITTKKSKPSNMAGNSHVDDKNITKDATDEIVKKDENKGVDDTVQLSDFIDICEEKDQIKPDIYQECHPCKRENDLKEADQWCKNCNEAFCEPCIFQHNRMKLFSTHETVKIDEVKNSLCSNEIRNLKVECDRHKTKYLEMYCFNHHKPCCVLCLSAEHRSCGNVTAIQEMKELEDVKTVNKIMDQLIEDVSIIMNTKKTQRKAFIESIDTIAKTMIEKIEIAMKKLSEMLEDFLRETLRLKMQNLVLFDEKIETAETFIASLLEWKTAMESFRQHASKEQLLLFIQKIQNDSKEQYNKLREIYKLETELSLTLQIDSTVESLTKPQSINRFVFSKYQDKCGAISISEKPEKYITMELDRNFSDFMDDMWAPDGTDAAWQNCDVRKEKQIKLGNINLVCGTAIDDTTVAVAGVNPNMLYIITTNSNVKQTIDLPHNPKKVFFSTKRTGCDLFIETVGWKLLYCSQKEETFDSPIEVILKGDNNEAFCMVDQFVYYFHTNELLKFDIKDDFLSGRTKVYSVKFFSRRYSQLPTGNRIIAYESKKKMFAFVSSEGEVTVTDSNFKLEWKTNLFKDITSFEFGVSGLFFIFERRYQQITVVNYNTGDVRSLLQVDEQESFFNSFWICSRNNVLFTCRKGCIDVYKILTRIPYAKR